MFLKKIGVCLIIHISLLGGVRTKELRLTNEGADKIRRGLLIVSVDSLPDGAARGGGCCAQGLFILSPLCFRLV